jgi:hypothetical protein
MLPHASAILRSHWRPLLLATALTASVGAAACDKVPLLAPSGTAISLYATANSLAVNGTTEITAVLIEGAQGAPGQNGQPGDPINGVGTPVHNGTVVTFTTTLGRIEPAEAKTSNGKATVTLRGDGRSGVATVTAFSGGASRTLEMNVGAAAATRIVITASPQSLPSGGGTAVVQARVEDQQGNGLFGVPVTFKTTAGTLSATSAVTGESGEASTTLTTTSAATISATAGGAEGTLTDEISLTIGARTTLSITPPTTVNVSTPAAFSIAVASSGTETAVVNDAVIDFGDGRSSNLGTLVGGATGAQTVIHLYGGAGVRTVTVSGRDAAGSPVSRSTQVAVAPLTVSGTATPGAATVGQSVVFNVAVSPAGASINRYEWDFGDGTSVPTASNAINHVYGSSGTKSVTVRIVPTAGETLPVFFQVQIN